MSRWGSAAPRKRLGTINDHLRGPLFPRRACFPPAWRISGAKGDDSGLDRPRPKLGQTRPKITKKRGPTALRRAPVGFSVPDHGHNPFGQRMGFLFVVFCPFFLAPNDVSQPNLGPFGPEWRPAVRNRTFGRIMG